MDPVTVVLSSLGVVGAVVAAVAALGSWKAAMSSARSAEALTRIERERRQAELRPRFELTCTGATVGPSATLQVRLAGPPELGGLDDVHVTIRDDRRRQPTMIANGPSSDDIASVIWGPLRFRTGVNGADRLGRDVAPFPLDVAESTTLALEESHSPRWVDSTSWRTERRSQPLRLTITCSQTGHPEALGRARRCRDPTGTNR
ncbi:MAG: hypothetical protein ACR2GH_03830 [Pseudonocardia sp.]